MTEKSEKKNWKSYITIGLLTLIFGAVVNLTVIIKTLTFDSAEQKALMKIHLDNILTNDELIDLKSHAYDKGKHMTIEAKDSMYVTQPEYDALLNLMNSINTKTGWYGRNQVKILDELKKQNENFNY